MAINDQGQIIGNSGSADAICRMGGPPLRPFLLSQGRMHRIDIRESGSVTAINNRGQVIGSIHADSPWRAFLWQDGKTRDLGTLPWRAYTMAAALNHGGQVVGFGCADGQELCRAFLWQGGKLTDLGTLPGGNESRATAINEHDQIVGYSTTKNGQRHAVLWTLRNG